MSLNKVDVLFEGYSYTDASDASCMRANCTCTLIRTHNGCNMIVDTLTAWDGDRLVEALQKHGLCVDDINHVICTHGHSDHIGCNYLFQKAIYHFVGSCISRRDKYYAWTANEPFPLDNGNVIVHPTPGHTSVCVSVVVKHTQLGELVGICGDLFEREEDIMNPEIWLNAGSEKPSDQRRCRYELAKQCDYIIPGHGAGFKVTQAQRQMLKEQMEPSTDD